MMTKLFYVDWVPFSPIVTANDEQGVIRNPGSLQNVHDHANLGINLYNEVTILASSALANKLLGRYPGPVRCWQREIQKKMACQVLTPFPRCSGRHGG